MPERIYPDDAELWTAFGHQHLQRYAFATMRVEGTRILDLACGAGYGTYVLSQGTDREVTGVDIDPAAIAYANEHYSRSGLRYVVADAQKWESASLYDTIVSFETIEHLADAPRFAAHLGELLRPGGRLILSAPNTLIHQRAAVPIENPYHLSEPDYPTLVSWLQPHFTIEAEWEQSTTTPSLAAKVPALDRDLNEIRSRRSLRLAHRVERWFTGRSRATTPAPTTTHYYTSTDIIPLLPERRERCEVFVFLCRRRTAS